MSEILPWMNLLLLPVLGYVMSIEKRLTRLETLREADQERRKQARESLPVAG